MPRVRDPIICDDKNVAQTRMDTGVNYWVFCITEDNLETAFREKVIGFRKGKRIRLTSVSSGDLVTFYVSKKAFSSQTPVQKFIGKVVVRSRCYESSKQIWQNGLFPMRIDISLVSIRSCQIKPLINRLQFIKNKEHWGGALMAGTVRISEQDFNLIQEAME